MSQKYKMLLFVVGQTWTTIITNSGTKLDGDSQLGRKKYKKTR